MKSQSRQNLFRFCFEVVSIELSKLLEGICPICGFWIRECTKFCENGPQFFGDRCCQFENSFIPRGGTFLRQVADTQVSFPFYGALIFMILAKKNGKKCGFA